MVLKITKCITFYHPTFMMTDDTIGSNWVRNGLYQACTDNITAISKISLDRSLTRRINYILASKEDSSGFKHSFQIRLCELWKRRECFYRRAKIKEIVYSVKKKNHNLFITYKIHCIVCLALLLILIFQFLSTV